MGLAIGGGQQMEAQRTAAGRTKDMQGQLIWLVSCFLSLLLPLTVRASDTEQTGTGSAAWKAWHDGDVAVAAKLADEMSEGPERRHLRFLCLFVNGKYEEALKRYDGIDATYGRFREFDEPVIDCYLHLGRYGEAVAFAEERHFGPIDALRLRAARPLRATLDQVSVIPFAQHKLTPFFPAFRAQLNGKPITIHVDTGAPFLAMGPDHAESLGIELIDYGQGFHGHRKVKLSFGIAQQFKLGDAFLENVPVIVFPSLRGKQMIFGTNVLQQFLATLDYPRGRLILSPRGDVEGRKRHMTMLQQGRVRVPFYMWGDHYMFARGSVGDDNRLNFFMDSGLVALRRINDEQTVQAGFTSSRNRYLNWGVREADMALGIFQPGLTIGIGPLKQDDLWWSAGPGGEAHGKKSFGGVQMHGLLAHAFLQQYGWTLDFENHQYIFSQVPATNGDATP
jgi:hypothetical protein